MVNRRFQLSGLFSVLLALMAQLGAGATVPRLDPIALITGAASLCHVADDAGGTPNPAPAHSSDCLVCPLCAALHAPAAPLPSGVRILTPPSPNRPPSQPRAPPAYS